MEKEKKKKSKLMIIIPIVIVIIIAIVGIVVFISNADPTKGMTKEEMLKVAESKTVTYFKELNNNAALAETQKGKIFKIYGKIYNITKDHVEIADSDTMLKIYLSKEELINLKKDQYITVVGSLNNISTINFGEQIMFFKFKNCYLIEKNTDTSEGTNSDKTFEDLQKEYREVKNIIGY